MIGSFWKVLEIDEIKEYFVLFLKQMKIYDKFKFVKGNDLSGCIGATLYDI